VQLEDAAGDGESAGCVPVVEALTVNGIERVLGAEAPGSGDALLRAVATPAGRVWLSADSGKAKLALEAGEVGELVRAGAGESVDGLAGGEVRQDLAGALAAAAKRRKGRLRAEVEEHENRADSRRES
jgi:hypothetical protein